MSCRAHERERRGHACTAIATNRSRLTCDNRSTMSRFTLTAAHGVARETVTALPGAYAGATFARKVPAVGAVDLQARTGE